MRDETRTVPQLESAQEHRGCNDVNAYGRKDVPSHSGVWVFNRTWQVRLCRGDQARSSNMRGKGAYLEWLSVPINAHLSPSTRR